MRPAPLLIMALAGLLLCTLADPPLTNAPSPNRVLLIEKSSTFVSGARATLIIGPLQRTGDVYAGDYQMKVSPYFFKNEKGKLAIVVSDASIAKADKGLVVEITGTATTNGKNGKTRKCEATATPVDRNEGALKLWFLADDKKMVFDTHYQFADP